MEVKVREDKNKAILEVVGELDFSNIEYLRQEIMRQQAKNLEIDLSKLKFMDSSGAGLLLTQARELSLKGRTLQITHIPEEIRESLELIGFFQVMATLTPGQKNARAGGPFDG